MEGVTFVTQVPCRPGGWCVPKRQEIATCLPVQLESVNGTSATARTTTQTRWFTLKMFTPIGRTGQADGSRTARICQISCPKVERVRLTTIGDTGGWWSGTYPTRPSHWATRFPRH